MEPFPEDSPFAGLQIASHDPLRQVAGRHVCGGCRRSSRYFCYRCVQLSPAVRPDAIPMVRLPLHLCIVKDKRELDGKTTSVHAKLVAPADTSILEYDRAAGADGGLGPAFDPETCVVLFPSADSKPVAAIDWSRVTRLVVLDGTWNQAKSMCLGCPVLSRLPRVHLSTQNATAFWRYQQCGPHCLSTIEAIHAFYREHAALGGLASSQFDNLLYFFSFLYRLIQEDYRSHPARSFTHRHGQAADYIKYEQADPAGEGDH